LGIFHSHPSIFPSCHFFSPWLLLHAQQAKRREQGQPWRGTLPASPGERLGQGAFFPNATPAPSRARHLLWSELEQRARRHPWSGTSATSPPAAMALFPVLQRPSSLPFSVHGEQELFPPMASSFPAHGATPLLSFFSISPCSLGRQQPWRGLLFFSWRSSKLPHGRRPGKLPQWRQQQGSLPPPHGAQKIAARLLCTSSPWSRFCAELRAGACHGQICPLHGCPLLFPAPSSLYPAPPFFPWKTNSEPPSSLFVVVPAGCSAKCAATRALPARCFVKPSGQHAADAHRGLLFLRSPVVVVVHPR
jgi:hypothetical protein